MSLRLICILSILLSISAMAAIPGADLLSGVILKNLDRDFDGKLDAAEWRDGTFDGFVEMDLDLDGSVVSAEIAHLAEPLSFDLGKVGAALCVKLIEQLFMTLDQDGDHRITRKEYDAGCAAIFQRMDTNADQILSKTELNELPARLLGGGK